MALPPTQSVGVGLALSGVVWGIYDQALPPAVDVRASGADNAHISSVEKAARWGSAGSVLVVSALTRDATVFIIGASTVIFLSILYRNANLVDPTTGRVAIPRVAVSASVDTGGLMPGH